MKATSHFRMGASIWLAVGMMFMAAVHLWVLEIQAEEPLLLKEETTAVQVSPSPVIQALDQGFSDLFEAASPAVVIIEVERRLPEMDGYEALQQFLFGRQPGSQGPPTEDWDTGAQGSGMVIRPDGYILTNSHVLGDGGYYFARFQDGRRLRAKLVGRDEANDLAVLKVEGESMPFLEFADAAQIKVGQLACVIGAPYALEFSFTTGAISGINRNKLEIGRYGVNPLYEDYLQTDASINPGNSGGPLLNIHGEVMGMVTMIHGINTGLGFAIPSDILQWSSDQLILKGRVSRPWLGISIETLKRANDQKPASGVLVKTVIPDAPAFMADVRPDDIIVAVDGQPVATDRELQKAIFYKKVGQQVVLNVWREKEKVELLVTTSEMRTSRIKQAEVRDQELGRDRVDHRHGVTVVELNQELAKRLGLEDNNGGVVIMAVSPNSSADDARLHAGDLVTAVNGTPIENLADYRLQLEEASASGEITLQCRRNGELIELTLNPPTNSDE